MIKQVLKTTIISCVLLLGSCGSGKQANEIIVWNQMRNEGRAVLDSLLDDFNRQNPAYSIRQTYYDTEELRSNFIFAALGESGPDLIFGPSDNVGPYAEIGIVHKLDEIFPEEFFAEFVNAAQVRRTVNGRESTYALADRIGNHLVLVYNRELLAQAPRTMSELIRVGRDLTKDFDGDGNIDQYALAWNYVEPYFMIPFLGGYGGWVLDENEHPTLDTEAMRQAAGLVLRLREQEKIVPGYSDYDIANSLFKQGRSAMVIDGPWAWGEYGKAGINYGIARIPMIEETGLWPTPMVSPLGWSINIHTQGEKLEVVKRLLRFLIRPAAQLRFMQALNSIPTHKQALADSLFLNNELVQASLEAREVGRMMPTTPALRGIWNAMKPAYQGIISGAMEPAIASRKMQSDAEEFIAEMYGEE
jgi:arabinogalactan oligomer/maltooligosaccharide transport system permease protein